eukprot:XP_014786324.1 PREDICTED: FYN-binding protein-like isoform X1 [Octopus bimaculoides]
MRAKLKMDGTEQVLSEGTYTGEVFKLGKLDLAIKKGDRINILRMHNNPAGKWLAKSEDGRLGYVESQFVEICASNIKNVMGIGQSQTQSSECPARYGWYSLCYGFCHVFYPQIFGFHQNEGHQTFYNFVFFFLHCEKHVDNNS